MRESQNHFHSSGTKTFAHILYLDYLRISAIFSVICVHVVSMDFYQTDVSSNLFFILNIFSGLSQWCVPILIMISGVLFLDPNKEIVIHKLYKQNILRLAIAFVFWSMVYACYQYLNGMALKDATKSFFRGYHHMWYLFMIIPLYMLVPVIRKISICKQTSVYLMILCFISAFVIPQIFFFSSIHQVPIYSGLVSTVQDSYYELTQYLPTGYLFYFLIGNYIHKYEIPGRIRKIIYTLGILSFLFSIIFTQWYSEFTGTAQEAIYSNLSVNIACMSLSVFLYGKQELSKIRLNQRGIIWIHHISKCTFGIYLVHYLIIMFLKKCGISTYSLPSFFWIPCLCIFVFIISYLITCVIRQIPVLKKYVV